MQKLFGFNDSSAEISAEKKRNIIGEINPLICFACRRNIDRNAYDLECIKTYVIDASFRVRWSEGRTRFYTVIGNVVLNSYRQLWKTYSVFSPSEYRFN